MLMYPNIDLYSHYQKNRLPSDFSPSYPDVTKRITLTYLNHAINLCENWEQAMDIGGGSGHYASALAAKFKKVTLVELEILPAHDTLSAQYPNIEVVHSYIEEYTETKKVDFILLADVYEHVPDINQFVEKIAALQPVGGALYVMTPNPVRCGPATVSGLYHKIVPRSHNGHIKHYTSTEIIDLVCAAGYHLELQVYEEAPLRQTVKKLLFALSRRDKKLTNNILLLPLHYALLLPGKLLMSILEYITFQSEKRHRYDQLDTLTQNLIFKKIQ